MKRLSDRNGPWLVSIDGMGGIGKTALAIEIAHRCTWHAHFDGVVWISAAADSQFASTDQAATLAFDTILNEIGRRCGDLEIGQYASEEKAQRVKALLQQHSILIVLDNLETAVSPSQDEIVRQLRPFLNPSKALLTSRKRFIGDVHSVRLLGLAAEEAYNFMRQEAKKKGVQRVETAVNVDLDAIVDITGGSPLAMMLVVSQLGYLPLDVVLDHLREVTPLSRIADEDEYIGFFRHVFRYAWQHLNDDDEMLLMELTQFTPNSGALLTLLQKLTTLSPSVLLQSIATLWRLSLLEEAVQDVTLNTNRYYLHPLTHYFVKADMVNIL